MSILRLIDFLSVMLSNKREDITDFNSKITFNHKAILNFLKIHDAFVLQDEVVKIFVLARRFRLSLQYIVQYKVPFDIEFFTFALESNAYDVAFYCLIMFENIITQYPKKAVNAHVQSYFINNQFLKAKLHMSCMMLPMFDFNAANEIIWILQ